MKTLRRRWRAWLGEHSFSTIALSHPLAPRTLLSRWLQHLMAQRDLVLALATVLEPWAGWNAARVALTLREGMLQERRTIFATCRNVALPGGGPTLAAAYLPLLLAPWDAAVALLCEVSPPSTQVTDPELGVMEGFAQILGVQYVPVVTLEASDTDLQAVAHWTENLARQAPHVAQATLMDAVQFKLFTQTAKPSRARAFLSQNAIMPSPASFKPPKKKQNLAALAAGARSEAERLLYDAVQADAHTRDLFKLNQKMPFRFGHQSAEIDLFCATLKLAVEVDGYHHFRLADNYRRDRRKDWELQRRGILLLRFLDVDVHNRPAMVVQAIKAALNHQKEAINRVRT